MQVEKLWSCVIYVRVLGAVVYVFSEGEDQHGKDVSVDQFVFLDELCWHL